jgi:putative holliday junction resolvase
MAKPIRIVSLDVGEKRIGVAVADNAIRIAVPYDTVFADGDEIKEIRDILSSQQADILVVGYPRNQSGEATAQTKFVLDFVEKLGDVAPKIVFQDESVTSVIAEQRLSQSKKAFSKSDIDAEAATIILQDYLEANYA